MIKKHQRGQALPLGLALALVATLGALVLYNTGRVATDKARLANAADAAAYSGLLWQARALNYQAYTNRAMVANQVSIAQAVSLRSWTAYGERTADNIATVLSVVPPMKVYAEGVAQVMGTLNDFVGPVADAMVGVIHGVNHALSVSQEAMHAASFAATPDIVRSIARESDSRFTTATAYASAGLAGNLDDWRRFTSRYDAEDIDPMLARTELINRSRDDFSRERDWRLFENFWFYSTPLTRHKIFREGETRLVATEEGGGLRWEWEAVDTLSLQNRIFRITGEKKQEAPIGWGAASASSGGRSRSSCTRSRWGFEVCDTRTANAAAEKRALRDAETISGYGGLNSFRSLGEETLEIARRTGDPMLRLRTEVALDSRHVRSSDKFVDGELLHADVVAPGERLSSISVAEVFYRRPDDGADERMLSREGATGYNPYWDVRLAPVSTEERLLAVALRGGGVTAAPGIVRGTGDELASAADDGAEAARLSAESAVGAASGGLPEYVGGLADAWSEAGESVDLAVLDERLSTAHALGTSDLESLIDIDARVRDIESGLHDELGSAVGRILSGAVDRAVGGTVERIEGDARDAVASVGEAVDSARGVYDTTVLGARDVVRDLGDRLDAASVAAEEVAEEAVGDVVDLAEAANESAGDVFDGVGDTSGHTVRGSGAHVLGGLDVAAFEREVASKVDAARIMAERLDGVRREVARRMDASAGTIREMTLREMWRGNFEELPQPGQFRGYDMLLLLRIANLMAHITYAVDPEAPMNSVMLIEASKFYYSEHVNMIRYGTPIEPAADGEADVEDDGTGNGAEDGEESDVDVIESWVEDGGTRWGSHLDGSE